MTGDSQNDNIVQQGPMPRTYWYFLVILAIVTYLVGYGIPLMDVDAAQYASISREMAEKGNYLEVTNRDVAYLDKPPLLFWLGSIFITIFGAYDWAYRLPTLLAILVGSYSVFRFSKLYYNDLISSFAGIMMLLNQAVILTAHDCRTDTLLMAAVAYSIWQLSGYLQTRSWSYFYGACIGIGAALLTKGPIGLIVPVVAFSLDWALKRQWKNFLRIEWLSALVVIAVILAPMTYGLYTQWGMKGVRFYYWTQSFGRITGESEWDNGADISFLFTNLLWSFLPWTPWFLYGLYVSFKELISQKFRLSDEQEAISSLGFLLPMLMLSTSKYQLPHYSYVLLGSVALLSAKGFVAAGRSAVMYKIGNGFKWLMYGVVGLIMMLHSYFSETSWVAIGCFGVMAALIFGTTDVERKSKPSLILQFLALSFSIAFANIILSAFYYPTILTYQAPTTAIKWVEENRIDPATYCTLDFESHAADFYSRRTIPNYLNAQQLKDSLKADGSYYILLRESMTDRLDSAGLVYEVVHKLPHYHVTKLTLPFLDKTRRNSVCIPSIIVKTTRVGLAGNLNAAPDFLATRPN